MPQDFISLRKELTGAVADLLADVKMECVRTQDGLVSVINALAAYREEGRALFPEVFVIDNLEVVLAALPSSEHVEIGSGSRTATTMTQALKQCAPLAQGGWAVYIRRDPDKFTYGLFRCGVHVLSVRISDVLVTAGDASIPTLMIRQIAENVVELRGVGTSGLLVHFGAIKAVEVSPVDALRSLSSSIVADVSGRIREQALAFFETLISGVLKASHGTLAAVQLARKKKLPIQLRDGIVLKRAIRVTEPISELLAHNDCLANTRLLSTGELITGMLLSDGITIFGSDGTVRAYNVFIKHRDLASASRSGGARRRTFETLRAMEYLDCVFMQSQDGQVDYFKRGSK
jgi:hypothetical protein